MNTKILTLMSLMLSANAFALPTIYPTDEFQSMLFAIKNPTDSNLVADNVNSRKVYVMPPNSAKAMVSKNLSFRTANLGFCREMGDLQGYSRNAAKDIGEYEKRLELKKKEVDAVKAKLSNAKQVAAQYAEVNKLTELEAIDIRMDTLDLLIKDKNALLKDCDANCGIIKEQIRAHLEESSLLSQRRRSLAKLYSANISQFERHKKSVEGFEDDLREAYKSWNQMDDDLASVKSTLIRMYKDLGSLEAARSTIIFKSHWDTNIDELRVNNPGYEFSKIQTENAVLTTDLVDLINVPSGSAIVGYQLSSCRNSDSTSKCETPSYPETISGTVVLSTIGACPIEHPEYFDLNPNTPNTPDQMSYGLTVAYEYPTAMSVSAKATYNMHKMYQKIVKSGKKGGFFRSKSYSSVSERTEFQDSFSVDWSEQDAKVTIPESRKIEIEQEMRNSIFGRLAKIGLPTVANPGDLIAPTVPKNGAVVMADELKANKACQTNYYCAGASIALNVLDAIFGSSSSAASYTNVQNADMTERWSSTSVVMKPYVTSYVKDTKEEVGE